MNTIEIYEFFNNIIFKDFEDSYHNLNSFLAHYTSMDCLEKILRSDEIWFSNPLFMNDIDELRFGMTHGQNIIRDSKILKDTLQTDEACENFMNCINYNFERFIDKDLFDTYVFCLSEHDPENKDGLLSMWRGYGGNGRGAAIVFDPSKLDNIQESPLIIGKVRYGSENERLSWLKNSVENVTINLLKKQSSSEHFDLICYYMFQYVLIFSLFTKHQGFKEEQEWRVVYMIQKDTEQKLKPMFHYLNGSRGVEPKLRFKVVPLDGVSGPNLNFDRIINRIILGPSASTPLVHRSVERMLEIIGKPELQSRLSASSIPFRAI